MLFRPHESKSWNPLIASAFYRRGHIETWGRGTLKIARLMQEAGLQPGASIPELALQLGKSESAIERAIRKLRAEGKLVCIGPAKGGHSA